jgi:ferredoxin-NADP reductase
MTAVASASSARRRATRGRTSRARFDAGVRLAALVGLWLGLLLVSYWWSAGGGIRDLGSWADGLTSTGRLTGLVASDLLLVQVLLMARVPVLERAYGQDRLAVIHRLVGLTSFNLMVAHVVLITWGYAAGRVRDTPGTLWTLTWDYPGMLLAVAGTLCLFLVVGTSIRAARRRLRYESWHLMHLYAYLGVGLALPHQLWTGREFLASPAATAYWWTLWALAAGAVLGWRVALPLWRSVRHDLRVTSVARESPDVVSVYLTGRRLDRLRAEPGQFFQWRFLGRSGWTRANPYSLSAAPDGRSLRITVKALGDSSTTLAGVRPGTRALVEGPYGRLSPRARTRPRIALLGAGVGITPIRALAEGLAYAPGDAVLLHRFTDRPLFTRELAVLGRERGLRVLDLPGHRRGQDSWLGDSFQGTGLDGVDDLTALRHWVPDIAERDVYVCGPEPWVESVRRTTAAAGLPAEQLHVETFGW